MKTVGVNVCATIYNTLRYHTTLLKFSHFRLTNLQTLSLILGNSVLERLALKLADLSSL